MDNHDPYSTKGTNVTGFHFGWWRKWWNHFKPSPWFDPGKQPVPIPDTPDQVSWRVKPSKQQRGNGPTYPRKHLESGLARPFGTDLPVSDNRGEPIGAKQYG